MEIFAHSDVGPRSREASGTLHRLERKFFAALVYRVILKILSGTFSACPGTFPRFQENSSGFLGTFHDLLSNFPGFLGNFPGLLYTFPGTLGTFPGFIRDRRYYYFRFDQSHCILS